MCESASVPSQSKTTAFTSADRYRAPARQVGSYCQLPLDQELPDQELPDQELPLQVLPDQELPDQELPVQLLPDQELPLQRVAGPGVARPGVAAPGVAASCRRTRSCRSTCRRSRLAVRLEGGHVGRVERVAEDVDLALEDDAIVGQVVVAAGDLERPDPGARVAAAGSAPA